MIVFLVSWGIALSSFALFISAICRTTLSAMILGYIIALISPLVSNALADYLFNTSPLTHILLIFMPLPLSHTFRGILMTCSTAACPWTLEQVMSHSEIVEGMSFIIIDALIYGLLGL